MKEIGTKMLNISMRSPMLRGRSARALLGATRALCKRAAPSKRPSPQQQQGVAKAANASRAGASGGGAASSALNAIADAESNQSVQDHLIRFGLWSLISLQVGSYFSQGDEGA